DQDIAGQEVSILVKGQPDERLSRGQRVRDEQVERQCTNRRLQLDLAGVEPVLTWSAIEQHLQCPDKGTEHGKAKEIEALAFMGGVWEIGQHAEHGEDAERHVDVEHPTPAI